MTTQPQSSADHLQSLLDQKSENIEKLNEPLTAMEQEKMEIARKAVIERHKLSLRLAA